MTWFLLAAVAGLFHVLPGTAAALLTCLVAFACYAYRSERPAGYTALPRPGR